jgi:murein DD-endopeptidase MepM/ murein hydrolase activator NlpD
MNKYWPLPQSVEKTIPETGQQGSFWENRGDRHHAGVDLYAPCNSEVVSIENGIVLQVKEFTSPEKIPYWNVTCSILIQNTRGIILRYAELKDAVIKPGDSVMAGQVIGHVGMVLNPLKIDSSSPMYIQKLKQANLPSMLHFEMHQTQPEDGVNYLGGNFFTEIKPDGLLDPTEFLSTLLDS